MFRQALAESQAWTPIESPWTLPTGLPGWASRAVRPASRRMSWLAASEIASPIAAGAIPSARAAAAASAAWSGVPSKIVRAHPVDPGVVGLAAAGRGGRRACTGPSAGAGAREAGRSRGCAATRARS